MLPRSAMSAAGKKSKSSTTFEATGETETAALALAPQEDIELELSEAVVEVVEVKETEQLVEEAVNLFNPNAVQDEENPTSNVIGEVVTVTAKLMVEDNVLVEICAMEQDNVISDENCEANGNLDIHKEDLRQGSKKVDEERQAMEGEKNEGGFGPQLETVADYQNNGETETETAALELAPPEEIEVELSEAVVEVKEVKETELLVEEAVNFSNPNAVQVEENLPTSDVIGEVVTVTSKLMVEDEMLMEICSTEQENVISDENCEANGSLDMDKVDLWQGSRKVDEEKQAMEGEKNEGGVGSQLETVAEINSAQEEIATAHVDISKTPHKNNVAVVVKYDDDGQGEGISDMISVQKSGQADNIKTPCENNTVVFVKDDGDGECEANGKLILAQESAQVDTKKAENNTIPAVKNDGNREGDIKATEDVERSDKTSEGDNDDNEGDGDPSVLVQDAFMNKKKHKDIEIYVGRLDKRVVEDDLVNVFQKFGELKSTRIVRNPTTKKSKGFAFIQFAFVDHAKRALSELKDGVEVMGKHVKISASQDKDTLYVGNICKTWTIEDVLKQLRHYGIEQIQEIHLPKDPKIDGKLKGFALLEFSTHSDAMAAFQRLRKPDAVFGRDRSAKVAFTQTPMSPNEEDTSQVKRVHVDGLAKAWNEEKVKKICKPYGEILQINLCRSPGIKHKDFGFVTFTSHESALACVAGINSAGIGGKVKIKASIAKPQHKGRLQKLGFRGGFKVEKESEVLPVKKEGGSSKPGESSEMRGDLNSQQTKRKRGASSEQWRKVLPESKNGGPSLPKKSKCGNEGENSGTRTSHKRKKASKSVSREVGVVTQTNSRKPLKKQKGDIKGSERDDSRNTKRDACIGRRHRNHRNSTRSRDQYAQRYASDNHLGLASTSTSTRRYADLEPHAGYIEPASVKQSRLQNGYIEPVVRRDSQHQTVYLEPGAGSQIQFHPRNVDHTIVTQSHRAYTETAARMRVQSYGGYRQPAIAQIVHDPYNSGLARAARQNGRGTSGPAYVGGQRLPASYISNHTSYAGYQAAGSYYQISGAHSIPRTHY